jgi:hypothetical protein
MPAPPPRVQHVIQIDHWKCNYMFGVDEGRFATGSYYDWRHIEIRGTIIEPAGIKATEGRVTCIPDEDFIGASRKRVLKFGERLAGGDTTPVKIRPVGHVYYRGKEYSAKLNFPADALLTILQMLASEKYRYLVFEAALGGRDAEVFNFRFGEHADDDDTEIVL